VDAAAFDDLPGSVAAESTSPPDDPPGDLAPNNSTQLLEASQPFVGRWSRLVSTTNWEKGRIIAEWRESLAAKSAPASEFSDEAWSRLVGGVTGQHAGRLRRVYQRFGGVHEKFAGLYWSHFQAAIDWEDAEMWLEGAVQSGWSVALMREQRWTTLGRVEADRPRQEDAIASETDEDFEPARTEPPTPGAIAPQYDEVTGPRYDGPDFGDGGDDGGHAPHVASRPDAPWEETTEAGESVQLIQPFQDLPDLPDDLADAFDSMKLAILHHKRAAWQAISEADALRMLDALKALVTAPADDATS
jgi:hypothetical protein